MDIKFFLIKDMPLVVIDNFYENQKYQKIFHELEFLNDDTKLYGPDRTGSALDRFTGVPIKQNKGIILDEVYHDKNISDILRENKKLFLDDLTDQLMEHNVFFRYLRGDVINTTIVQYYEDSDYYDFHTDASTLTAITWFYKEPKKFDGGDLVFEDNSVVKCITNRIVIFPSILYHSVAKITMDDADRNKKLGRYSITQLIGDQGN